MYNEHGVDDVLMKQSRVGRVTKALSQTRLVHNDHVDKKGRATLSVCKDFTKDQNNVRYIAEDSSAEYMIHTNSNTTRHHLKRFLSLSW